MTDSGACPAQPTPASCTWRVVEVHKRVHKNCSDNLINMAVYNHNQSCFNQCPEPLNSNTTCFATCFYNTVLGPDFSSHHYDPQTATMPKTIIGKVSHFLVSTGKETPYPISPGQSSVLLNASQDWLLLQAFQQAFAPTSKGGCPEA